ncbi:hypothetical protein ZPAH1_orf00126 [Aeromonas phage ZPAH1]|nr:hypothetical protein ASwh1_77 [Aeromonas phage Aswh_1]QQG33888.1 hypothetical protein ZPAH1_orf00126 [Aeromonas phage ZPAH1]
MKNQNLIKYLSNYFSNMTDVYGSVLLKNVSVGLDAPVFNLANYNTMGAFIARVGRIVAKNKGPFEPTSFRMSNSICINRSTDIHGNHKIAIYNKNVNIYGHMKVMGYFYKVFSHVAENMLVYPISVTRTVEKGVDRVTIVFYNTLSTNKNENIDESVEKTEKEVSVFDIIRCDMKKFNDRIHAYTLEMEKIQNNISEIERERDKYSLEVRKILNER